jgi:hypothetical protein
VGASREIGLEDVRYIIQVVSGLRFPPSALKKVMRAIITLTADFGCAAPWVGVMKGVMLQSSNCFSRSTCGSVDGESICFFLLYVRYASQYFEKGNHNYLFEYIKKNGIPLKETDYGRLCRLSEMPSGRGN